MSFPPEIQIHEVSPTIQVREVSPERQIHETSPEICTEFGQKVIIFVVI